MSKPKQADTDQVKGFIEAARAAGCSEDEAEFDENLKRITKSRRSAEKLSKPTK